MKTGDLVKYSWAGSNRVAIVIEVRNGDGEFDQWLFGAKDRMLIQWLTGAGPKPRMYDDNGTVYRSQGGADIGWVSTKNDHGWPLFDEVSSLI